VILGVLAGFAGIIILIGPAQLVGIEDQVDLTGGLVLALAAFSWSLGSLYNRGARLPASPLLGTGMEMILGAAGLLLLGTIAGEWSQLGLSTISTRSLLGMAYLIVFASWVGFVSYIWLLRVAPTMLVSTYAYVNPLIAIFMGSWLANEALTPRVLIAAAIIIGSVILITMTQSVHSVSKSVSRGRISEG
jgi:drug/metabolite transporter (DMT)-like permease